MAAVEESDSSLVKKDCQMTESVFQLLTDSIRSKQHEAFHLVFLNLAHEDIVLSKALLKKLEEICINEIDDLLLKSIYIKTISKYGNERSLESSLSTEKVSRKKLHRQPAEMMDVLERNTQPVAFVLTESPTGFNIVTKHIPRAVMDESVSGDYHTEPNTGNYHTEPNTGNYRTESHNGNYCTESNNGNYRTESNNGSNEMHLTADVWSTEALPGSASTSFDVCPDEETNLKTVLEQPNYPNLTLARSPAAEVETKHINNQSSPPVHIPQSAKESSGSEVIFRRHLSDESLLATSDPRDHFGPCHSKHYSGYKCCSVCGGPNGRKAFSDDLSGDNVHRFHHSNSTPAYCGNTYAEIKQKLAALQILEDVPVEHEQQHVKKIIAHLAFHVDHVHSCLAQLSKDLPQNKGRSKGELISKKLRDNLSTFINDAVLFDLVDYLFQCHAIEQNHVEEIEHESSNCAKNRKLLYLLLRTNPCNWAEHFVEGLKKNQGTAHLVSLLE